MHVDFDDEVGAWFLTLAEASVASTVHVSDEVAVDLDANGEVIGVEFLLPPAELGPEVVAVLFARFPVVRTVLAHFQALAVA